MWRIEKKIIVFKYKKSPDYLVFINSIRLKKRKILFSVAPSCIEVTSRAFIGPDWFY